VRQAEVSNAIPGFRGVFEAATDPAIVVDTVVRKERFFVCVHKTYLYMEWGKLTTSLRPNKTMRLAHSGSYHHSWGAQSF
jgi:hypothetical protein